MRRLLLAATLLLTGCASGGEPVRQAAPQGCPERTGLEVPAEPTAQTVGRLVPEAVPEAALVCRYGDDGALTARAPLTAGLEAVPADLLLPGGAGLVAGDCAPEPGPVRPVLLRLDYPDGVVWLAAPEQASPCAGTTNGRFTSGEHVGDVLVASAGAGRWTVPPLPDAGQRCVPGRTGRRGQESTLLPPGARTLTVCRVAGDGVTRRTATPEELAAVQDVLDEPVAVLTPRSCAGGGDQVELAAGYDAGPSVLVRYAPGCDPDVDNGSLRADLGPAERARLEAVLRE